MKFEMLNRQGLLERAKKHIFSTGLGDAASDMARINMAYGLAKIHIVQNNFGLHPDATFVSSPDETISRNPPRWEQGISYGGKLSWGPGKEKLMVLDVMPNACGMLVGGLDHLPDPKSIVERVDKLEKEHHSAYGIDIKWDFYKGNHFIDVFQTQTSDSGIKLPKYMVIMHAGCSELKKESPYGMGLYVTESKILWSMCKKTFTPFGYIYTLEENDVKEYYNFYLKAEKFASKRREIAFKEIFSGKVMINETHQGLLNFNECALGCQIIKSSKQLLPVSIRADLPSYLFHGKKNFTKDHIMDLGWKERANEFGVMKRLLNANLLPHGGGYCFPDCLSVSNVFEVGGKRYYEIDLLNGIGKKIISNVKELEFAYRSRDVVLRTISLGLGSIAANLNPVYTVKF